MMVNNTFQNYKTSTYIIKTIFQNSKYIYLNLYFKINSIMVDTYIDASTDNLQSDEDVVLKFYTIDDTTEGVEVTFPPNIEVWFEPGNYHEIECWLMDGNVLYGTHELIGSLIK